jgi:CMP/dCMP kinase
LTFNLDLSSFVSVNDLPSHPVITIDGPAASGKSSVARLVAARLGFIYVNTGNMYRAMSWAVLDAGIDATDAAAVRAFAARVTVESMVREGRTLVGIGGRELSDEDLNSDAVNGAVSHVASVAEVRAALVAAQRDLQKLNGLVMEGRDIGSVVFPESPFKFYIDACEAVRAARRQAQGHGDQVAERDRIDSTRKTSPLVVPEGAEVIDNSYLTLEQAVERVLVGLRQRGLTVAIEGQIGGLS